jgi:hypothetical protein
VSNLFLEIFTPFGGVNSDPFTAFLNKTKITNKGKEIFDFRLPPLSG